ncbi:MAG: hypothetical protein QF830_07955 [Rhodospirillales bacterium]|jgi:hypothetical protein|nr:hypothetical protein [Rhodospirillales bacterium]MDP6884054.1 hypothetical protein [Rhodospirillales bacterium]
MNTETVFVQLKREPGFKKPFIFTVIPFMAVSRGFFDDARR